MRRHPLRKCEKCSKEYRGEGERFCSQSCAGVLRRSNKICVVCKVSFYPDHIRTKFCSRKCWFGWLATHAKSGLGVSMRCVGCSKEFTEKPSHAKERKYCSYSCSVQGKRKLILAVQHQRARSFELDKTATNLPRYKKAEQRYKNIRHRANRADLNCLSRNAFVSWYINTPKICEYCGIPEEIWETLYYGKQYKFSLSIDRKNNDSGYELWNMALACHVCNVVKNQFLTESEMRDVAQRYLKPKWQAKIKEGVRDNEVPSVALA